MTFLSVETFQLLGMKAFLDTQSFKTQCDPQFDRITRLAAKIAQTSIALVSFRGADGPWAKSWVGPETCDKSAFAAVCGQMTGPVIVPNASADIGFRDDLLVGKISPIQFFAGFPLVTEKGEVLGTLSVFDERPQTLSPDQIVALTDLAALAVDRLEATRQAAIAQARLDDVRKTRNFFRSILDTCDEAIAAYEPLRDAAGNIVDFILTDCNEAACRIREASRDSMVGQKLSDLVPRLLPENFQRYCEVVRTGEPASFDTHYVDNTYDDWFRVSATRHSDGGLVLLTAVITKQKRDHLQLRRSRDALDTFTAAVSHDLRTPLGHIVGFVQLMREDLEKQLSDQNKEFMGYILEGADQMRSLIDAMQKHARLGKMVPALENVDLQKLATEIANRFSIDLDDVGAEVELGYLPEIKADPVLFDQMLSNLMNNALQYRRKDRSLRVRIHAVTDDKVIALRVSDNGAGIDPESQKTAFKLFSRGSDTRGNKSGLGVGLAICNAVALAHGGTIAIEKSDSEGTCFVIRLPNGRA